MSQQSRHIYLDVSALCRPFDDQEQMRIRLETDAVQLILANLGSNNFALIVSPAHDAEIRAIDDLSEREHLQNLLKINGARFSFDLLNARQRAEALTQKGVGIADAAHLAFAEQAQSDFITCDDRLIRQCRRIGIRVWYGTPIAYCEKENLR
ncbi:MAG: PIN domain-containing protein [Chloroflexi bacterium]|nr:PIN domain-containing protein [Chloroflexota bacterium]